MKSSTRKAPPKTPSAPSKAKAPAKKKSSISFDAGRAGFRKKDSARIIHSESDQVLLDSWAQPRFSATPTTPTGTLPQNTTTGALVCPPIVVSPLMLDSGRLATMASLFQEWRPKSVVLRYRPTVGEFNNGSLIFAFSKDPSWTPYNAGSAATTYSAAASIKLLSEQSGAVSTHIAKALRFQLIKPGDFKGDQWFLSSPSNPAGLLSRLVAAGVAWIAIEGLPTNSSGTALATQPGYLSLEYQIEFRGATDNPTARVLAETVNNLQIRSAGSIASGSPFQFTLLTDAASPGVIVGPETVIVYPSADIASATSGTVTYFAQNQPIFLSRVGINAYYYAYTTLIDAIAQSANTLVVDTTTTVQATVAVSSLIPLNPQAAG
jgi:hypothetical protein